MFTDYSVTVLLIVSTLIMLIILFRAQKTMLSSNDLACSWSGDHWVTNAGIKMTEINKVITLKISDMSPELELHEWIAEKLGRPIRSGDVIYENDLTFLVIDYRSRHNSQIYIYPSEEAEASTTRPPAHE